MDFFFGGLFWGVLLILIGIGIILKVFFDINIPIFRTALALLLIYLGVTGYRYMTEEKEKKRIRGAFQYYLTASVVEEMLKKGAG